MEIRWTGIKDSTQLRNTDERTTKYTHEIMKLSKIDYNDITEGYGFWYVMLTGITCVKGCFIDGEAGTGKITTAIKNKITITNTPIQDMYTNS